MLAVKCIEIGVVFRRVKAVGGFPCVGHSVLVGIEIGRTTACAEISLGVAIDIAHLVNASPLIGDRAFVGAGAIQRLAGIALVHVVATERGTGVGENLLIGLGSSMRGNVTHRTGLVELHTDVVGAADGDVFLAGAIVVVGVFRVSPAIALNGAVIKAEGLPTRISVVDHVAVDKITAGHAPVFGIALGVAAGTYGDGGQTVDGGAGAALVVVAHHIDLAAARAAIAAVGVVDDTVAEVDILGLHSVLPVVLAVKLVAGVACPVIAGTVEARRAVGDMQDEVVVEGGQLAAPDAAIAVGSLAMACVAKALANGAPLHGEVVVVIERGHLVDAPRERAVVEHHTCIVTRRAGIGAIIDILLLSTANTDEAHHNVIAVRIDGIVAQSDAGRRCRLPHDSGVGTDIHITF